MEADAVPGSDEPWHGRARMSKLSGAPCLAHATEADAVAEGRSEPVEDDVEQVVREFGPRRAVALRSFLGRWHDDDRRRAGKAPDLVKHLSSNLSNK